jgi:hypothetical protein
MTRSMLGRTAFAGTVALALGFGMREAAAGAAREERPYCRDEQHCQDICDAAYPTLSPVGICSNNERPAPCSGGEPSHDSYSRTSVLQFRRVRNPGALAST